MIRFQTLGAVQLHGPRADRLLALAAQPKRLALLAYLAVANRGASHRRDTLVAMFWPELNSERARAALRKALHHLREGLGPDVIVTRGDEEVWISEAGLVCDARQFQDAVRAAAFSDALELYTGDFLVGLHLTSAPDFDQWLSLERRRLSEAAIASAMSLATAERTAGRLEAAIRWAEQAVDLAPLEERQVRLLLELLLQTGDRAAALQAYDRFAGALAESLDVAPSEAMQQLVGALQRVNRVQSPPAAPPPVPENVRTARPAKRRPWRAAAALAAIVLVAILPIGVDRVRTKPSLQRPGSAAAEYRRLLVRPFSYQGLGDRGYLGTGIADEIAARLSPVPGLELLAAASLENASKPDISSIEAGRRVGADLVLEGSVQTEEAGRRQGVRVTSRLIAVRSGNVLGSWVHDGELSDMLAVQAAIADSTARRIVIALSVETSRRIHKLPTISSEAFDFYLRAGEYLRRGRDGLPGAIDLLGKAIERDSNFALALARYGETHARLNWFERDLNPARMERARVLIERAIVIDPFLPEAHLALAYWLLYDRRAYSAALAQLDTVLTLQPNHAEALAARAQIRRRLGNWDGAARDFELASDLDPLSYSVSLELGNTLLLMREYARAEQPLNRARALSPDAVDPVAWLSALAFRSTGDTARAADILSKGAKQVDAHKLLARMVQTFPDVMRAIQRDIFVRVSELSLEHAFGDTAAFHMMMARRPTHRSEARVHVDTARVHYESRARADPAAYGPYRHLAELWILLGQPDSALRHARRARELMPVTRDAMAGSTALQSLAETEIAAGMLDSAAVHLAELLRIPSAVSEAAVRTDPLWSPIRNTILVPARGAK